jgi:hypothetical protein
VVEALAHPGVKATWGSCYNVNIKKAQTIKGVKMHEDSLYEAKDKQGRPVYELNYHICPPESGRCYPKGTPLRDRDHEKCFWYVVDEMILEEGDDEQRMTSEQVFGAETLRECKAWALENYGIKAKRVPGHRMQAIDFDSPDN